MNRGEPSRASLPTMVLFDLDGTLADTARDLLHALERLCHQEQVDAPCYEEFRPTVSLGSIAMLKLAFDCEPGSRLFDDLRDRFLALYRQDLATHTELFPGMAEVLTELEANGVKWGVVTNKPGWLTEPLLAALGLDHKATCVVSGDTLPKRKPHPDQLLFACECAGVTPQSVVYVGDARVDIEAGSRAGMRTVAALFGYIPPGEDPYAWRADKEIARPDELIEWLDV